MSRLTINVLGAPAPQGSKTPWGSEANPATRPWRALVSAAAREARGDARPFAGPVCLDLTFRLKRPKAHYRTGKLAGELKDSAPLFVPTKPDWDKLARAIGDALTDAGVWLDDSQVAVASVRKVYASAAESVGVTIVVQAIDAWDTVSHVEEAS